MLDLNSEDVMKFADYIYRDATVYLQRKYDRFIGVQV